MIEATPEEKHWLETCIKTDQFVSYEEAMKTFIPEYVECISLTYPNMKDINFGEIGRIYKVLNYNYSISDMTINEYFHSVGKERFKPSTKEAYDAQFVVKEKENTIVIEKPKVVFEEPKDKVLRVNYSSIVIVECAEGGIYKIGDKITVFTHNSPNKGKVFTIEKFRWSKDKSKICAITEIHKPNGIGLNLIELYVEPKVKVTHNFKIGDKISIVYNTIAGSGVFIIENIEGNRLIINNEEGTLHNMHKSVLAKNAKLVEAKQELSLLEQAKLKYPIGTKVKSLYNNSELTISEHTHGNYKEGYCPRKNVIWWRSTTNYCPNIYDNGKWAEIVDDFVLPEKWCVQVNPENQNFIKSVRDRSCSFTFITSDLILPDVKNSWYCHPNAKKRGFTEITLEQFKKHVLKNE